MANNENVNVRRVPIADLHNDPANVRSHDNRNIEAIAGSLTRFGQQKPIVVDPTGVVIAGNGTLEAARSRLRARGCTVEAARSLGWESIVVVESDLSGAERTAYAIADNRTAELASWDEESLSAMLQSMDDDLRHVTGFSDDDIASLLASVEPPSFDPMDNGPSGRLDQVDPPPPLVCPHCGGEVPR